MAVNNNVNIIVKASDQATKTLKKVWGGFWKLNDSLKNNADKFRKIWAIWWAAFVWIWLWIKNLTNAASGLEEITNKLNVVYRDLWDQADNTAKELADWYWLSTKAAKWFLADLWDVTSWFWLSQKASLEYANTVTKLWVDLASFSNIAWWTDEAVERLNKWLLWEHENLKALWIIINETMLKKQLLADWTSELNGLELEQAKIQARLTIATKQSQNAIWDFARSQESLANQTRIAQAKFEDITTALWTAFLPIITEITAAMVPIIESFAKWVTENQELVKVIWLVVVALAWLLAIFWTVGLVIPTIIAGFTWIVTVFGALSTAAWVLWKALMFLAANPIWLIITAIAWIIIGWLLLVKHWDEVKIFATNFANILVNIFQNLKDSIVSIFTSLKDWVWEIFSAFTSFVKSKLDWIFSFVTWMISRIKSALKTVAWLFWGWGSDAPSWWIDWARANWWPVSSWKTYLVWERWPELFTPMWSWNITPNNELWGNSLSVNINMWGVSVNNQADETRLVDQITETLTRQLQINKFWVV